MFHRLADNSDFDTVYDLYMDEKANPYLTYDLMSRDQFRPIFDSVLKSQTLYVAERDEEIIGTYRLISKSDRQKHTVYIGGFTIKQSLQGQGLGSKLLSFIKSECAAQGKTRIELTVDVNNAGAIALYKKMGFVEEGVLKNSYKLNSTNQYYDEYLMAYIQP
jgi:RimJ/RimL family protein N-acetyltransferase